MAEIEMVIDSIRVGVFNYQRVLILKEKGAERYLPISVDPTQADIIASLLSGREPSELADYDLPVPGVDTTALEIKSVIISCSKNNVFNAKLLFSLHNKSYEVDCPIAKAIALSVKEGVPILVEEALLNEIAIGIPKGD